MIRIICAIKHGCEACSIAVRSITEAVCEANCDITLSIRHIDDANIKFPTTYINKVTNDGTDKELAKIEGSFPSEYIKSIINKLEKE